MKNFLHHFRRNRSYQRHDRWMVFGVLAAITLLVLFVNWGRLTIPKDTSSTLAVVNVEVDKEIIVADGDTFGNVVIWIEDENGKPVDSVWIGLKISEPLLRTSALIHSDWYSYEPDRSFYQTDTNGRVEFSIASEITGEIEYHIYSANPEASQNQRYQNLNSSFTITFEKI